VLFEKFFYLLFSVTDSYGLAILLISVLISLILMPFYHITHVLESREKAIRLKLQPYILKINKIKDVQLRHKCISKLYKSFEYSPIKSLRLLSSLVIQIPFFIIAYKVLSRILVVNPYAADLSFLCIKNLGVQDALLGGVNLLPILMTLINILSVMFMTPIQKERKQSYVIAVFFLIFLYMSPAGLVLYWTANNFINLLRYLFIYLKNNGLSTIKRTAVICFSSLLKNENFRAFLFLISVYFAVNAMVPFIFVDFNIGLVVPLYILVLIKICDYVKENLHTHSKKSFFIELLIVLCFVVSVFVKIWEKFHWLFGILVVLTVCDYKNIRLGKMKNIFKSLILPVVSMLFPVVLYAKANTAYLRGFDICVYFAIFVIFACTFPLIVYLFNNRLSVSNIVKGSTAFIMAAMFLPLIREAIKYVGHKEPIDFLVLFLMAYFIVDLFKKNKKVLILFFLCATSYIFISNIDINEIKSANNDSRINDIQIPKDLSKKSMVDTPAIYLFMHDAFPHRDLRNELNLENSKLDSLLKKYDFKEYNVYSIAHYTMPSMAATFDMKSKADAVRQLNLNNEKLIEKYWKENISGNNMASKILKTNAYKNFIATAGEFFFTDNLDASMIGVKVRRSLGLVNAIIKGKMNSALIVERKKRDRVSWHEVAMFAKENNDADKIFAWGYGYPGHSSGSGRSSEYEIKRWSPRYLKSISDMEKELKLTITNNPNAIVILMSDHGPWLIGDARPYYPSLNSKQMKAIHFRDTFGAFMAVRWPDKERAAKYDKEFNITQDLFPIILAYLYDSPEPLKYKIKDTAVRIKDHKFDKGVFYPHFYKEEQ
jgi:hypothetical protein